MPATPFRGGDEQIADDPTNEQEVEPDPFDARASALLRAELPHIFDTGEEEEEEEDDDDSISESPPVMNLLCTNCETTLTTRGMEVFLVAEPSSKLYSTDIPSDSVREGGRKIIDTCECDARALHCVGCQSYVGYHVRQPCRVCGSADHNGHFWLFSADDVSSMRRDNLTWADLPYNGAEEDVTAPDDEQLEPEATCAVCAAAPMWRPTRVPGCGHVFCFGCISREVDMRGCCPLDRRPVMREALVQLEAPPARSSSSGLVLTPDDK